LNVIHDAIVLGAGAAGLMCAAVAGQRGKTALVLERAERAGKKILISGGGRCNFTNLHAAPENYLCGEPNFHRSALARYSPEDFIALVEKHGIAYHEKKLGQLFCDGSSRQIVELLLAECAECAGRVRVETGCEVNADADVSRDADGVFTVRTKAGAVHRARALVVATGGLSFAKLGGSDFGHRLARRFGLRLIAPRPGLVPLTFADETLALCAGLSGVAVPCVARTSGAGSPSFRENLLFTHRGMSGPAILQISSYLPGFGDDAPEVLFDLLPDGPDPEEWLLGEHRRGREVRLANLLAEHLPARLAESFSRTLGADVPLRQHSAKRLAALARTLRRWTLKPAGTEGYPKAEVTLGGVDTRDLHSKTMAARNVPGLYFIGEVVDVTGHLGGFNFQWAWASGYAAGMAL
jgi:predicted Rossmann fold flavoprotein